MSMDDVLCALQIFHGDMDTFTNAMGNAATDLEREHDSLAAVWTDTFSQQYQQQWQSFDGHLERYLNRDSHGYRDFLEERTMLLGKYLNG